MNYVERYALAVGGGTTVASARLLQQVAVAAAVAAVAVMAEDPGTTNHTARIAWATRALTDALAEARRMVWGVLTNGTIATDPLNATDNDVQFVVNSLVDAYTQLP
jgi:hypothetical protein